MSQILSHRNLVVIINDHRFLGWAQEDQPVEFPNPEMLNITIGPDGAVYATDTGDIGGPVTLRLNPSSPSVKWCIRQRQRRRRGNITYYKGSYQDIALNKSATFAGGVLLSCPPMAVPNVTFEVMFHFEVIDSDVDAASFAAPPAVTV